MAFDHGENFFSDGRDPRRLASRTQLESQVENRADHELARRRSEFAELQRRHRYEMDEIASQKRSMFGRTPPEVAVNALTLAIEEAHHLAKLRLAEGHPTAAVQDIRLFQPKIQGKEVEFHIEGQSGKPSFIDDGKSIFVPAFNDDIALLASLQLAQMRWGVIKVSGTDDFQDRVVQLAADHDLTLANEDLALRVHQRRNSPGTLSAPSKEELEAAKQFQMELKGEKPESVVPKETTAAASDDEALVEDDAPQFADTPIVALASDEPHTPSPTVEEKSWIAELQEERRRKAAERAAEAAQAATAPKESAMPKEEYDRAVEAEIQQLKKQGFDKAAISSRSVEIENEVRGRWEADQAASTIAPTPAKAERLEKPGKESDMPEEPIVIDEPEEAPDLGYGDDDDFSVEVPSAATVTPEAKKTAGIGARP